MLKSVGGELLERFEGGLRGTLRHPGGEGFDERRRVWNGMIDRTPGAIVACAGAADVVSSVRLAKEHDLLLAVRGGGHSFPGHSTCDDGLVIDCSPMKGLRVDPARRTVRAQSGVLWGELDREAYAFGLAVTGGQISHTGIAGLTLGGGVGWLARSFGLSCDNVLALDVVTADGELRTVSETEEPDLFWALRGGGGNFGVVTSFEFRLHPLGTCLGGLVAHPLERAGEAMRHIRDFAAVAPDELTLTGAFLTGPDGQKACGAGLCYAGAPEAGQQVVRPLREFGPPVLDSVGPMPYPAIQSMLDEAAVPGRRYYMRSHLLEALPDEALDLLADRFAVVPSPFSLVILIQLGGAVARVPSDTTAYPHRDATFLMSAFSCWEDPTHDERNVEWARQLGDAMAPFASGRFYVNELFDEGEDLVRAAYGPTTYERLSKLKARYDPTNLFRLNQNIKPKG